MVFVPEFEVERVRAETAFERVESYPEYPGLEHPMRILARVLADIGHPGAIGADQDGYPGILGYQGPALSEATASASRPLRDAIESMMARKSASEIELIRESARWCEHAHRLLQEYSGPAPPRPRRASGRATRRRSRCWRRWGIAGGQQGSPDGAGRLSRPDRAAQLVGPRGRPQHRVPAGDVLVTETSAPIWGYHAELERAMIIGPPSDEVRRLFVHTVASQQAAFDALRPGVTCADVDGAVMRYLEDNDLLPYWRQHTGHAIGLRNHEAPFLDLGDHTPIEPGMVFTIEPALRRRRSAASATRTPSLSRPTGSTSSPTTRATSRASPSRREKRVERVWRSWSPATLGASATCHNPEVTSRPAAAQHLRARPGALGGGP